MLEADIHVRLPFCIYGLPGYYIYGLPIFIYSCSLGGILLSVCKGGAPACLWLDGQTKLFVFMATTNKKH